MAIRIDVQDLYEVLRLTPPQQNIMLLGKHGIGKSEIIVRFYRQKGMTVVPFFLGQMSDPGDLIGLLHKDEVTGRSIFLPPHWWPVDGKPIVLFLDELNRARPEILQSVHDLALNRTLAGKTLPAGSSVISAVNEGEEYQLTELDPALVSRFNLYEFAPTTEDWLLWATKSSLDQRVISFIQKQGHHLDGETQSPEDAGLHAGLVKTPDRRAWVRVSDVISGHKRVGDLHIKIIAGIVGTTSALAFQQHLATTDTVSAEQILLDFGKHRTIIKELSLQEIVLLNEQILYWINSHRPDDAETVLKNLLAYLKKLQQVTQNEALAHFASMLESPGLEAVMGFIAESVDIITLLTDYIEGIRV